LKLFIKSFNWELKDMKQSMSDRVQEVVGIVDNQVPLSATTTSLPTGGITERGSGVLARSRVNQAITGVASLLAATSLFSEASLSASELPQVPANHPDLISRQVTNTSGETVTEHYLRGPLQTVSTMDRPYAPRSVEVPGSSRLEYSGRTVLQGVGLAVSGLVMIESVALGANFSVGVTHVGPESPEVFTGVSVFAYNHRNFTLSANATQPPILNPLPGRYVIPNVMEWRHYSMETKREAQVDSPAIMSWEKVSGLTPDGADRYVFKVDNLDIITGSNGTEEVFVGLATQEWGIDSGGIEVRTTVGPRIDGITSLHASRHLHVGDLSLAGISQGYENGPYHPFAISYYVLTPVQVIRSSPIPDVAWVRMNDIANGILEVVFTGPVPKIPKSLSDGAGAQSSSSQVETQASISSVLGMDLQWTGDLTSWYSLSATNIVSIEGNTVRLNITDAKTGRAPEVLFFRVGTTE
jgi:hypothetical protein